MKTTRKRRGKEVPVPQDQGCETLRVQAGSWGQNTGWGGRCRGGSRERVGSKELSIKMSPAPEPALFPSSLGASILGQRRVWECSSPNSCLWPHCHPDGSCPRCLPGPCHHPSMATSSKETVSMPSVAYSPFSFLDEVTFSFNETFQSA